jgi:hypothetical protein
MICARFRENGAGAKTKIENYLSGKLWDQISRFAYLEEGL